MKEYLADKNRKFVLLMTLYPTWKNPYSVQTLYTRIYYEYMGLTVNSWVLYNMVVMNNLQREIERKVHAVSHARVSRELLMFVLFAMWDKTLWKKIVTYQGFLEPIGILFFHHFASERRKRG